jgi:hypothetical protein
MGEYTEIGKNYVFQLILYKNKRLDNNKEKIYN